jgi:hypothetical protein
MFGFAYLRCPIHDGIPSPGDEEDEEVLPDKDGTQPQQSVTPTPQSQMQQQKSKSSKPAVLFITGSGDLENNPDTQPFPKYVHLSGGMFVQVKNKTFSFICN